MANSDFNDCGGQEELKKWLTELVDARLVMLQSEDEVVIEWETVNVGISKELELFHNRINQLLQSETLLVTAAAFLYTTDKGDDRTIAITAIGCTGVLIAAYTLVVIALGCRVLRNWLIQGNLLLRKHRGSVLQARHQKTRRELPDWIHNVTIDVFGFVLPLFFAVLWILCIWWMHGLL